MRVGDLLQGNVKEVLDYYGIINSTLIKLTRTSEAIEKLIPGEPSDLRKDEYSSNWEAIEALAKVFKSEADYLDSMQGKIIIAIEKLRGKANQIMSVDKRSAKEIEEVMRLIKIAHEESDKVNVAESKQIALLGAKLDAVQASLRMLPAS
jgi:antitoxin component of RelBE/YafQ-DinJ toxin-antitoxin module